MVGSEERLRGVQLYCTLYCSFGGMQGDGRTFGVDTPNPRDTAGTVVSCILGRVSALRDIGSRFTSDQSKD